MATAIVVIAIPGPNMLFILGRGVEQGTRAAFAAALGIELGTLVHVLGTVAGLSALIAASPEAFNVVKYGGAAYLFYLAIRTLLSNQDEAGSEGAGLHRSLPRLAGEAAMVNVLNPKVALFFLALLPQFIDPGRSSIGSQTLLLGLVFFVMALALDLLYATMAVPIGARIRRSGRLQLLRRYFSVAAYLLIGVNAAFMSPAT